MNLLYLHYFSFIVNNNY